MHKGYKFSAEQLAERKRKKKGTWSKAAKERQSVRMKERFRTQKKTIGQSNGVAVAGSVKEALEGIKEASIAINDAVDVLINKLG